MGHLFDLANGAVMLFLVVITLYPFLHVAFASVSSPSLLMQHRGLILMPLGFSTTAYQLVFNNPMILRGYLNTVIYVVAGTALNLVLTSMGAYVLSRKRVLLRNALMFIIVFQLYFSGGLIPFYLLVKSLGLIDNRLAMIVPTAIISWNLIVMMTSFKSIPDSMEESAKMDGANDFTVLTRIILPLSLPVVAVMILFYSVSHWNEWFYAMVFLRRRPLYPLQLILREILITSSIDSMLASVPSLDKQPVGQAVKYATIIVATLPVLLIYPFLQRYFVSGVMIGALKE